MNRPNEPIDVEIVEDEHERRDIAASSVIAETDPKAMLTLLEETAAASGRMRAAMEHILVSQTYPKDWTVQGDKACLSSAGAERLSRQFPISYDSVKWWKEDGSDGHGKFYRYIYEGFAEMRGRRVFVTGSYSTRDKFLGYASGEWKDTADINEGHIRMAAYHVFCGNAVKMLLGLRGIPAEEYRRIMGGTGRDAAQTQSVNRGQGTQGGTAPDDQRHQTELWEICLAIADVRSYPVYDQQAKAWGLHPTSEMDERTREQLAAACCETLSAFQGKDGIVKVNDVTKLRGKWLNATVAKARACKELLNSGPAPWDNPEYGA